LIVPKPTFSHYEFIVCETEGKSSMEVAWDRIATIQQEHPEFATMVFKHKCVALETSGGNAVVMYEVYGPDEGLPRWASFAILWLILILLTAPIYFF
jgi:hypothetical protein